MGLVMCVLGRADCPFRIGIYCGYANDIVSSHDGGGERPHAAARHNARPMKAQVVIDIEIDEKMTAKVHATVKDEQGNDMTEYPSRRHVLMIAEMTHKYANDILHDALII